MAAPHRYVFLGPQGSGKGTQAALLAAARHLPHVSTGELFRAAVAAETPLGRRIAASLSAGGLVADGDTNALVAERLGQPDAADGYVLDGYPRTVAQAEFLDQVAAPTTVVVLELDDEEAVRRLSGRRVCQSCGAMYHEVYQPPQQPGRCDRCDGQLRRRHDDEEVAIRERLRLYHRQTEPLVAFYRERARLVQLDGRPSIADVAAALQRTLER
jgi:adenylate kinase